MNLDEAILTELKKLSAFADMQRKITKWTFIFIGVFIAITGYDPMVAIIWAQNFGFVHGPLPVGKHT
jgi:hypothetical protein